MHSDFLAHIELVSSACARLVQKHTLVVFLGIMFHMFHAGKGPIDAHGRTDDLAAGTRGQVSQTRIQGKQHDRRPVTCQSCSHVQSHFKRFPDLGISEAC
jgi:hypothetical protein